MKTYEICEQDLDEVIRNIEQVINYLLITEKRGAASRLANTLQKLEDSCWIIEKEK